MHETSTRATQYKVSHRIENELSLIVLRDQDMASEVAVLPSFGALLHSYTLQTPNGGFNIIDNYKSLDEIRNLLKASHKSSKLSPFVCRIKNGKYRFSGSEFEFQRKFQDGSAIHGLLADKPFEVIDESYSETSASVNMQYHYQADDEAYPFDYSCVVKYELKSNGLLLVETKTINTSKAPIPIADGWHPYFTLGGKTDNWELSFNSNQMVEFDDTLIPTGRLIPNKSFLMPEKIEGAFLDHCFLLDEDNSKAACVLRNPENGLQLLFFPIKDYPYLQIYTPPHRKSIAIENLSSAPDCFNNGMGLIILEPGHSQTFTLAYQLLLS